MSTPAPSVRAVFDRATEIESPTEREAYLTEACAGRPDVRREVEVLLQTYAEATSSLESGPVAADTGDATAAFGDATADPPTATLGTAAAVPAPGHPGREERAEAVIDGKYTLLEPIGEGGMGSVWRARQTQPVRRYVAVKLIKAGMDSRQVLARFDAERQALALMDHPNIARVLDGGLHDGRPYFVMELVEGVPITGFCDARRLTPRERLELFVPVCQAIQHAHQKGVIHRDIKPSNVLIALYDDRPVPKVIDFGVAKATGAALTEHTIDTGLGGVVGTPQYMSPEQATLNNMDIDTRSDVYALGVLLYELLTGSTPFSRKELETKGVLEILRVVREEEPPRPSTKLSTAAALATLSANRGTEPRALTGLLRSELDWVVMKALEKDRARRYETATALAAEVRRYLAGEAVQAHPPGAAYRLRKFVRRNRPQVVAAGLVLLALVAGVIGTTVGLVRAMRAADAERIARDDADEQRRLAERAAEQERRAREREVVRAEGERRAKLEAEAKRREAERNLAYARKGNEILGSVFAGLDPKRIAESGRPLQDVLRENLGRAVKELEGSAVGDPLEVAAMQDTLGLSLVNLGEPTTAVEVLHKALSTRQARLGPDHPDTLSSMNSLAVAYRNSGQPAKAVPLLEEALAKGEAVLGPDHPVKLTSMNTLALAYDDGGQPAKAVPLLEAAVAKMKAVLGPDHPNTLRGMNALGNAYQASGQPAKAVTLLEEALVKSKAARGPDHPDTLTGMNNLAGSYLDVGQSAKAVPLLEEALAKSKAVHGPDHPFTLIGMNNLAEAYRLSGQLAKAVPLYEEALTRLKATIGPNHPYTLTTMGDLGATYAEAQQGQKAAVTLLAFADGNRKQLPKDSPRLGEVLASVSYNLLRCGQHAAAEPLLRECLAARETHEPDAWTTHDARSLLGAALLGQRKYAAAEPLLVKGYEGLKAREKSIPQAGGGERRILEALDRLIELGIATNRPDEAAKWRAERAKYPGAALTPRQEK